MVEEIAVENGRISNSEGLMTWPWPWIGSYCIPSCISHRCLPTRHISLKSKKLSVDRQTYARAYICTHEQMDIWDLPYSVNSVKEST